MDTPELFARMRFFLPRMNGSISVTCISYKICTVTYAFCRTNATFQTLQISIQARDKTAAYSKFCCVGSL